MLTSTIDILQMCQQAQYLQMCGITHPPYGYAPDQESSERSSNGAKKLLKNLYNLPGI